MAGAYFTIKIYTSRPLPTEHTRHATKPPENRTTLPGHNPGNTPAPPPRTLDRLYRPLYCASRLSLDLPTAWPAMSHSTPPVSPHAKAPREGYASAVKEIEQEKQMVAALKRLSFGHLLNNDPDVPFPDELRHEYPPQDAAAGPASPPGTSLPDEVSPGSVSDGEINDEANTSAALDVPIDATPFWVPANVHPEINPNQFRSHVQSTIDHLLERKLLRSKSTRSKRSSLSLSTTDFSLPDDIEDLPPTQPATPAVADSANPSNPSLRVLTSELEELLRLAGMNASDAVTLARSLSTSSLGYTDAEKQAFDDMGQGPAPRANHAELLDLGADDLARPAPQPRAAGLPDDFALRRSRRLDYRKPHGAAVGSQLQTRKAENLAELRNTLAHSTAPSSCRDSIQSFNPRSSQILFSYRGPAKSAPPQASMPRRPLPTSHAFQGSKLAPQGHTPLVPTPPLPTLPKQNRRGLLRDAAYQESRRVSPITTQSTDDLINFSDRHYAQRRVSPKIPSHPSYPLHLGHKYGTQASLAQKYPAQGKPLQHNGLHMGQPGPESYRGQRRASPNGQRPMPQNDQHNAPQNGQRPIRHNGPNRQSRSYTQYPPQSESVKGPRSKRAEKRDKTRELNQNLDLLRTEINEFKESLSKTEPNPAQTPQQKTEEAQRETLLLKHPDFSFDLSSHDISYEDSLGIETEILQELNVDNSKVPLALNQIEILPDQQLFTTVPEHSPKADAASSGYGKVRDGNVPLPVLTVPQEKTAMLDVTQNVINEAKHPLEDENAKYAPISAEKPEHHLSKDTALQDANSTDRKNKTPVSVQSILEKSTVVGGEPTLSVEVAVEKPAELEHHASERALTAKTSQSIAEKTEKPKVDAGRSINLMTYPIEQKQEQRAPLSEKKPEGNKIRTKKSFGSLTKHVPTEKPEKKKATKKSWLWSKERSVSTSSAQKATPDTKPTVTTRAISSPDLLLGKKHKHEQGKENVIAKLFKKKRSTSMSSERGNAENGNHERKLLSSSSKENEVETNAKAAILRKISNKSHVLEELKTEKTPPTDAAPPTEQNHGGEKAEAKSADEKVKSILRSTFKKKSHDNRQEIAESIDVPERKVPNVEKTEEISPNVEEDLPKPQTTQEVQEKLKKSIKRTSRPNQPIEFTDSAFGFPLPPPSQSTLVMIDHRFPVHVERAIYRLSHLKLANPKRSLREQVLLSNFMYAYLNLVDHTLHLEQQLTLEEHPLEQPEAEIDAFNAEDPDTEFEIDDDLDEGTFDTIKLDLDAQDNRTAFESLSA